MRSSLGRWLAQFVAFAVAGGALDAQQTALKSHEVNNDLSVTFRYYAPTAQKVTLGLDYDHHEIPMTKGADGVWTLTTGPLQPAVHTYDLSVDDVHVMDPLNPSVDPNLVFLTNDVRVIGKTPQLWDVTDVPHGVLHHHTYFSKIIVGLPGGEEDYYVYTPPGYNPKGDRLYPLMYLLHGWSSLADSWVTGGQANLILDNLIAQGRVKPMVVVMPLGYGDLNFAVKGFDQWNDEIKIAHNLGLFSDALLGEIAPQVQSAYCVSDKREDRAIAGLSMGGGESLVIGLNHPEYFGWVGGFSSAVVYTSYDSLFPHLRETASGSPQFVWIACGTSDALIDAHRKFVSWLKAKGLHPTAVETPGIHNWPVWRDDLIHFSPLLFRASAARP